MRTNDNISPEALRDILDHLKKNPTLAILRDGGEIPKYQDAGYFNDPTFGAVNAQSSMDYSVMNPFQVQNPYAQPLQTEIGLGQFGQSSQPAQFGEIPPYDQYAYQLGEMDPRERGAAGRQYLRQDGYNVPPIQNPPREGDPRLTTSPGLGQDFSSTGEMSDDWRTRLQDKQALRSGEQLPTTGGTTTSGGTGGYRTLEDVDTAFENKDISLEEANRLELSLGNDPSGSLEGVGDKKTKRGRGDFDFAGAASLVGAAGNLLSGTMSGIRDSASLIAREKRNRYVRDWYNKQQQRRDYTPVSQARNANYLGGFSYGEKGGEKGKSLDYYPYGGKKKKDEDYYFHGGVKDKDGVNVLDYYFKDKGEGIVDNSVGSSYYNYGGEKSYYQNGGEDRRQGKGFTLRPNQYGELNRFDTTDQFIVDNPGMFPEAYVEEARQTIDSRALGRFDEATDIGMERNFRESARTARNINERTREEGLPFQKVKMGAFVDRDPQNRNQQFNEGGQQESGYEGGGQTMSPNHEGQLPPHFKVGSYIEFEEGGSMHKGVIKKIENGKIYL